MLQRNVFLKGLYNKKAAENQRLLENVLKEIVGVKQSLFRVFYLWFFLNAVHQHGV
ncbi:hypothetical protein SAMN05421760_1024 [Neptunomonas antarctica]|uniref:Uncharacterized protein n=1 Tax=Neptunomonas antarctica TaxID=619304 RepID=A0A1N7JU75_9GAMM|nr:hypothetical protein SAMN05421760_1024 [Neptunomonas antarctica]